MEERWISPDKDGFEREVLYRLGQLERRVESIDQHLDTHLREVWARVHLLEIAQAQVKVLAVAFATFTGIISTVLSKVWR